MTDKPPVPTKRRPRGRPANINPHRLGGIASTILQGDSIKAACHSALVPETTYRAWTQRAIAALEQAKTDLEDDDIEGRLYEWIDTHGGFGTCGPDRPYWTAPAPTWWPKPLTERWTLVVFLVVVTYARARAEQVYRAAVTRAAQGSNGQPADWRAAQFMLTHSFGWRDASRIEVTGADGGPIEMQSSEEAVLAGLAALAEKRKALES